MNSKVDAWIDVHSDELVNVLRENMKIPSVKGDPAPGAPLGTDVKRALDHALDAARGFGFAVRDMDGYIGIADYGEGSETLGVMAHLDVVPAGEGWEWEPFGAALENGRILGRGAMDDKGPAFAAMFALAAIKECGLPMKRRVRIMLGCDEESGWDCIHHYNETGEPMPELAFSPDADYPVVHSEKGIYQGTFRRIFPSALRIRSGERANVVPGLATAHVELPMQRVLPIAEAFMENSDFPCAITAAETGCNIEMRGLSAHTSTPELGKNALTALLMLLDKLPLSGTDAEVVHTLCTVLGMEQHGESAGLDVTDASGRLSLNPGVMDWDDQGLNGLTLDIRYPACLNGNEVTAKLLSAFAPAGLELAGFNDKDPHFVPEDSELVSALMTVYRERTGDMSEPKRIGGGTYARAMENAVAFGCERDGIDNRIHMPNEFIDVKYLLEDCKIIADAIIALACR